LKGKAVNQQVGVATANVLKSKTDALLRTLPHRRRKSKHRIPIATFGVLCYLLVMKFGD
jgi:hypothetical protein